MGWGLGIFTKYSGPQFEFQALVATMTRQHQQKLTHVWCLPDRMANIGSGCRRVFCAGRTQKIDNVRAKDLVLRFHVFHRVHIPHQSWISSGSDGTQSQLEKTPFAVFVANR